MTGQQTQDLLMLVGCLTVLWLFGFLPFLGFLFAVAVANSIQEWRKAH